MYKAHYINPLIQHGRKNFDLILTDDAGELPTQRIAKSFIDTVTEDEILIDANNTIIQVLETLALPIQDAILPQVDLPEGNQ